MPSLSFQQWITERMAMLDDIERAHRSVRGTGRGARAASQQINQAYVLLLSAQFQSFCRDLHSECATHYVTLVADPFLRNMLLSNLLFGRKLDRGNPNPGNIGSDFNRLDVPFWPLVVAHRASNATRKIELEDLNAWRNAIAHQDFALVMLRAGRPLLTLAQVQDWRKACDGLARSFDDIMHVNLQTRTGIVPW